jgi:hypothetical protein
MEGLKMGISLNGLNSGLADTYSSLLSSGSSSSSSSGISSLLSDYASIKNGSYGKLMKAYYGKTSASDDSTSSSSTSSTSSETDKTSASAASSAYKSAEKLTTFDFSEDNVDDAYTAVSDFITNYNSMMKNASSSSNTSVQKQAQYLYDTMYSNYKLFANVGITLNSDRTLSINEDTFKNSFESSEIGTVKTLFNGTGSFADQVSSRASQIYRYASDGQSITAKSYTSSGTYSTTNTADSTIDSTT